MSFTSFTLQEYIDAECMQMEVMRVGVALHVLTDGKICDGCPEFEGGGCISLRKMQPETKKLLVTHTVETVREEAIRRNIGIKEVRRQRQFNRLNL